MELVSAVSHCQGNCSRLLFREARYFFFLANFLSVNRLIHKSLLSSTKIDFAFQTALLTNFGNFVNSNIIPGFFLWEPYSGKLNISPNWRKLTAEDCIQKANRKFSLKLTDGWNFTKELKKNRGRHAFHIHRIYVLPHYIYRYYTNTVT